MLLYYTISIINIKKPISAEFFNDFKQLLETQSNNQYSELLSLISYPELSNNLQAQKSKITSMISYIMNFLTSITMKADPYKSQFRTIIKSVYNSILDYHIPIYLQFPNNILSQEIVYSYLNNSPSPDVKNVVGVIIPDLFAYYNSIQFLNELDNNPKDIITNLMTKFPKELGKTVNIKDKKQLSKNILASNEIYPGNVEFSNILSWAFSYDSIYLFKLNDTSCITNNDICESSQKCLDSVYKNSPPSLVNFSEELFQLFGCTEYFTNDSLSADLPNTCNPEEGEQCKISNNSNKIFTKSQQEIVSKIELSSSQLNTNTNNEVELLEKQNEIIYETPNTTDYEIYVFPDNIELITGTRPLMIAFPPNTDFKSSSTIPAKFYNISKSGDIAKILY